MSPLPELHTARLQLRAWSPDDAEHAFRIYGDPEVMRYLGGALAVSSVEALRTSMRERAEAALAWPEGQGVWAAWRGQEAVGTGLLKPLPDHDGHPTEAIEVGWHLRRDVWGQGYATELGQRLLRHGLDTLGLPVVHAVVDAPNLASHKVCQRLGMRRVGLTTRWYGQELIHYELRR